MLPQTEGSATSREQQTDVQDRAIECARIVADNRGRDVVVLDMREIVKWVDYIVIGTGTSRRQIAAIADEIESAMAKLGEKRIGIEGYQTGNWVVIDYADIIVHLFNDESREYYELEELWGDAPRVAWQRPSDRAAAEDASDQPGLPRSP